MKPMVQPDIHPDADLLNAFAEQALPQPERAKIIAHMAGCARCREVVYLAQAAAKAELAPAAVAKPESRPRWSGTVFGRWRVALIPAVALAAVGAIVLWVQLRPPSRPVETAQLASPPQPLTAAATVQPPPQAAADRESPAAIAPPAALTTARPGGEAQSRTNQQKKIPSSDAGTAAMLQLPDSDAAATSALSSPAAPNIQPGAVHLDGRSAAMARYTPPPSVSASSPLTFTPQQRPMMRVSPGPAAPASETLVAPSSGNPPPPAPSSPGLLAVHGQSVVSPTDIPSQIAVQSLQQVEVSPQSLDGLPVLRLARRAKLPSGLETISSASLLNRLVAVDSAGAVFLSHDGGRHWEAVFAPWEGKAVEVQAPQGLYRLMPAADDRRRQMTPATANARMNAAVDSEQKEVASPPPSGASTAPAPAAKVKSVPPTPAMLFRLVTDRHEVWVSPDGKIWREP